MKATAWLGALIACASLGMGSAHAGAHGDAADTGSERARDERTVVIQYDSFKRPGGYTLGHYAQKWSNPFGPGEMAVLDTRAFEHGKFSVSAVPFKTAADFSVFDHIKYFASSTQAFAIPANGSIMFSAEIEVSTPGTEPGRVIRGTYGPPGSYPSGAPYEARTMEGQQAAATLHMIDFETGQLFDWFVSGKSAFTLIERLPSSVTGSALPAGRDKIYTQVVDEVAVSPGPHKVAIRLTRREGQLEVEYFLDGRRISHVRNVGVPLDAQGLKYTGTFPSLGAGEQLANQMKSVYIGHGLFSLLDAFPFNHAEAPELSVSIPLANRIFGQGAHARFDQFVVTVVGK